MTVPSAQIVVVDGEADWRQRVAESVAGSLRDVKSVENGLEAFAYIEHQKPGLVITELLLPDVSGLGLCRLIREHPELETVGVLMVTRYASEIDRVLAFEAGVDDFLAKPFSTRELESRARAVLRRTMPRRERASRSEAAAGQSLVTVHPASGSVFVAARRIDLTPSEYRLLETLVRHAGRVWSRKQLIETAWPREVDRTDRVVDAHIKSVRRKLGEAKGYLETVRGVGYRFSELCGVAFE